MFTCCNFDCFELDFFLKGFSKRFLLHSRPSFFLLTKFPFLANDFFHMRHFNFDYLSDFFEMVFPIHSVRLVNENFDLKFYVRTCPVIFFGSLSDALYRFTFVHTAKLKKSNFMNRFFLSLTAFARVVAELTNSITKLNNASRSFQALKLE